MDTRVVFATSHDGVRVAAGVSGAGFPMISLVMPLLSHARLPSTPEAQAFKCRLESARRLIQLDLRGCGLADWDPPSHTMADYMHDIIAVLHELRIDRVDVMALGGRSPVAVRFAARFPDRVRRLYLQGITVGENAAAGRPLLRPTARHLAMEDWQLYLETVASRVLGSEAHVAAYVERMTKCSDRANLFAALDALDAEDTAEDVRALQCPTLVAEVEGYTLIESGQTERFVTLAPGAQVRYLPNRPGWLADFVAAIEDFETELDRPAVPGVQLSPRETEVLTLLASGHTNSEIASALNLSRSTVDRHIANIYAKLNVRNRAEATRWALTHGLDLAT